MRKVSLVTLVLLALAGIAGAQVPKGNIFGGYSFAKADIGGGDRTNPTDGTVLWKARFSRLSELLPMSAAITAVKILAE